ncbi:hypothetical protein G6F32_014896 [Rhizopus arrhizus]|nr:hypothetical protein G6F32_014896 [Rhizopus arrhizus]
MMLHHRAGQEGADQHAHAIGGQGDEALRTAACVGAGMGIGVDLAGDEEEVVADAMQHDADHQQRAARQRRQGDGLEQPQRQHAAEHARMQGDGIVAGGAGVGEHGRSGAGDNRALSTLCRKRYPRNRLLHPSVMQYCPPRGPVQL